MLLCYVICDKNDECRFDLNYNDSDRHALRQSTDLANQNKPYSWYTQLRAERILEQLQGSLLSSCQSIQKSMESNSWGKR